MSSNIVKSNNFNNKNVSFSEVKNQPLSNGSNRKFAWINYNRSKFVVQTPQMRTPFGLNENENSDGGVNYSVNLTFDDSEECKQFHKLLSEVSEAVKKQAMKDSLAWFKKKSLTEEQINMLYKDHIKRYVNKETGEEDGKFPDTVKFKLPYYNEAFQCKAYDHNKEPVEIKESISKGCKIKALIQCTGVYFINGNCGVSWKVLQMKVEGGAQKIDDYAFIDSDDEMTSDDEQTTKPTEQKVNIDSLLDSESDEDEKDPLAVQSSSEDDEDDEEDAPPPPKKKGKGKKK